MDWEEVNQRDWVIQTFVIVQVRDAKNLNQAEEVKTRHLQETFCTLSTQCW